MKNVFKKIGYVEINVSNLIQSTYYYQNLLGFSLVSKYKNSVTE